MIEYNKQKIRCSLHYSTTTVTAIVYIRYCERKSCVLDPQQPARRSWAWWRPGWGWWRSDGWSAYGRVHETYRRKWKTRKRTWRVRGTEAEKVQFNSKSGFVTHLLFVVEFLLFLISNSRIRPTEDEEGAAHWNGLSLFFDGEFRQPLRAGPQRDIREVIIVVIIITH